MSRVTRSVYRALLRAVSACDAAHVPLDTWRGDALACVAPHAAAALDAASADAALPDAQRVRAAVRAAFRAPLPASDGAAADAALDGALTALRRLTARTGAHAAAGGAAAASSSSSRVSHGILCAVRSTFVPERSTAGEHIFSYEVTFRNDSAHPVQLATRAWAITTHHADGSHSTAHVRGPGVVGEHPRLLKGESFTYRSFCGLRTPRGTMRGEFEWVSLTGEDTVRMRMRANDAATACGSCDSAAATAAPPDARVCPRAACAQYTVVCDPFALRTDS
jgi:ApaG protein